MRTVVIVQARMGSSRLPGKVMEDLVGQPVLAHVLKRCKAIPGADVVVCAVPDEAASVPLEEVARRCGVEIFRGSEADVLDRYYRAAQSVRADVVMRVTSDCPLIDPMVCGQVSALLAREQADYACNNMPRSFPHGLDCEAFTFAALEEAVHKATQPDEREHVTPYLRQSKHFKRVNLPCPIPGVAHHRWTLDYMEDLDFFRAVFCELPGFYASYEDVLFVLEAHPEIYNINIMRHSGHG